MARPGRESHRQQLIPIGHEAIPPPPQARPGLVQAAAVLDWFRCMAGPTESDLECDSNSGRPQISYGRLLAVVLDSPFVAANYAAQISHGSPTSARPDVSTPAHGYTALAVAVASDARSPCLGER